MVSPSRLCDGLARRELLQVGGLGTMGPALPELFQSQAQAARATGSTKTKGRAKSCILLFMGGGPPQMDTFDLKPNAPAEVRGEPKPIATSVPGLQISEQLPLLAKQMHHCSVIRSMSDEYTGGAHGQSVYPAITGHKNPRVKGEDFRPASDDYPCVGSVVARLRGQDHALPPSVWLIVHSFHFLPRPIMQSLLITLRQTPQPSPAKFLYANHGCWIQYFDDTGQ